MCEGITDVCETSVTYKPLCTTKHDTTYRQRQGQVLAREGAARGQALGVVHPGAQAAPARKGKVPQELPGGGRRQAGLGVLPAHKGCACVRVCVHVVVVVGHACLDVARCACVCTCVIVYGGARLRVCAYVHACALPGFGPLLVPLTELVAERGEQVVHEPSGGARVIHLEVSTAQRERRKTKRAMQSAMVPMVGGR